MIWTVSLLSLLVGVTLAVVRVRRAHLRHPDPPLVLPDPVGALKLLRVEPKPSRGAGALIVEVEWGRVVRGDVLLLPLFHYADVVAAYAVVQVDTLPSADDSGLLSAWVDDVYLLEVETSVGDTLPPDTLVEVFYRVPAA